MSAIHTITILGGHGKAGGKEAIDRIDLRMGDVVSIVGPTGSGKTTLINDIELFADANTPTGRRILINGERAPEEYRDDPSRNPIALITQHTTFLSDLPVREFLETHARIRSAAGASIDGMLERTLAFANQLTGEPILVDSRMTELSGGPDPRPAHRRRHHHLQHAHRAAGRSGERRHPSHPRPRVAARIRENIYFCDTRSAHRASFGLPHRDAERDHYRGVAHGRKRAPVCGPREPVGRHPVKVARPNAVWAAAGLA